MPRIFGARDGGSAISGPSQGVGPLLGPVEDRRRSSRPEARLRRSNLASGLLVLFALLASGCGSGSDSGSGSNGGDSDSTATDLGTPVPGGTLVVAVPLREPKNLLRLTLESLTTFSADGSVVPFLAESVEPNGTYDRWTIKVREGIEFHNGEALDAEAVKLNLDTYSVSPIYKTDPLAPILSTTVVDEFTVEVELSQPWVMFPAHLAAEQSDGTGLIAAPETLGKIGPLFLADPGAEGLFGTGPFILDDSDPGDDKWEVKRNPDYWQEGLPYVDQVEIVTVQDRSARLSGLESGDYDIALNNRPTEDPGASRALDQTGELPVLAVALNMRSEPLDDPDLRLALAAATDVESLARTAGVDPSAIASSPFGPSSTWTDTSIGRVEFDLDRAKGLVDAIESDMGPVAVRLGAQDPDPENLAVQQELAAQWESAGVDVDTSVIEPFQRTATLIVTADFDAMIGSLFGMPDPDLYYFWWHSSTLKSETKGAGYNYIGMDDPDVDDALDASRGTTDAAERESAMNTVQARIADANPYVWLWETPSSLVFGDRVKGLDTVALPDGGTRLPLLASRLNLEGVWLER